MAYYLLQLPELRLNIVHWAWIRNQATVTLSPSTTTVKSYTTVKWRDLGLCTAPVERLQGKRLKTAFPNMTSAVSAKIVPTKNGTEKTTGSCSKCKNNTGT